MVCRLHSVVEYPIGASRPTSQPIIGCPLIELQGLLATPSGDLTWKGLDFQGYDELRRVAIL